MKKSTYLHNGKMRLMYYFLFLCFVLCTLNSWSQNKGIVYYGQIESVGLKSPLGPDFNSFLVFDKEESYYVTAMDSLENGKTFEGRYSSEDGQSVISFSSEYMTSRYGKQVYNNRKKDTLYWNQWVDFYVAEKTPSIDWKLEKETKKIGNFLAHKAIGKFRGRKYTAWYILEVPLPFGPWKLQGLPGLILEAYDDDKEMYLYFKSLEFPTKNKTRITQLKRPDDHPKNWRSLEEFKNRLDYFYNKRKNSSIIIAQKYGTDIPDEKIKSDLYLESF